MSIQSRYNRHGAVFENWQITELIGQGSGGKTAVFRLKRTDSDRGQSALKVVSLIEECDNYDSLPVHLKKEYDSAREECKKSAVQEVWLMNDLQGNTHIVDYLDHTFVEWCDEDGFGCDMLIRMELLKDLRNEISKRSRSNSTYSEDEIIKIGRDICTALVLCHGKGILHRDIKPENIFINSDGNYKLGDFGVSRILSSSPSAMASTGIGTPEYAAPEQFTGKHDKRIDIYSLGLVLYELSNGNKLPFALTTYVKPTDVERRQKGEPLPPLENVSKELARVILKACAYKKEDRYQTAEEFLSALNQLSGTGGRPVVKSESPRRTTEKAAPKAGGYVTQRATADEVRGTGRNETLLATSSQDASSRHSPHSREKRNTPKGLIIGIICLLIVAIGFAVSFGIGNAKEQAAIESYLNEANEFATSSDYVAALAKIEEGLGEYPDSTELQAKKDAYSSSIEEDIANIISDANTLAGNHDFEGAISTISSGLVTYPDSEDLQEKKSEYTDALNAQVKADTLAEAASFAETGDLVSAIQLMEQAMEMYGDDPDYQDAHRTYCSEYRTGVFSSADALSEEGDYIGAITTICDAKLIIGDDAEIDKKVQEYEDAYATDIISQTSNLISAEKYSEATILVEAALAEFPNNQQLLAQKTAIQTAMPKHFMDVCAPYDYLYSKAISSAVEMSGERYSNGFVQNDNNEGRIISNLGGKYSKMTFTVGHVDDTSMCDYEVEIYLDGTYYDSFEVQATGMPFDVTIPLSGKEQLLIKWETGHSRYQDGCRIAFTNIVVYPDANYNVKDDNKTDTSSWKNFMDVCEPYDYLYSREISSAVEMSGEKYSNGFVQNDNNEGRIISNLGGKYSEMTFTVGHVDGTSMCNYEVEIYLDSVYYDSFDVKATGMPFDVTIPVSGKSQIMIQWKTGHTSYQDGCRIAFADVKIQ